MTNNARQIMLETGRVLVDVITAMKLKDLAWALDEPLENFQDAAIAYCNQQPEPMAVMYSLIALAEDGEPMPWDKEGGP